MKLGLFSVSTQIHVCSLSTRGRERGWGGGHRPESGSAGLRAGRRGERQTQIPISTVGLGWKAAQKREESLGLKDEGP